MPSSGAGQSGRSVPVNAEPSHGSRVGRNHPEVIKVTFNAVEQANMEGGVID